LNKIVLAKAQSGKACRAPSSVLCGVLCFLLCTFAPLREQSPPPYKNPSIPVESRVDYLVARMTLEE
jgi:hypothetical protein